MKMIADNNYLWNDIFPYISSVVYTNEIADAKVKSPFVSKANKTDRFINLATRVIPSFIVSESSVGETFSKTVLPHFPKDTVA